ncbi:MAG TPA: hypothetical protein VK509_09460 [Polyangiales bacterium]|nr:hypothetical protein [Polyangiales bacterium]
MLSGVVSGRQAWTSAEDAALQEAYAAGGVRSARAALPHRTNWSIFRRAQRLCVVRSKSWTKRDDAKLRTLWDGCSTIDEIAAALGRRKHGVYRRAQEVGLTSALPAGWEYLTVAAKRTGYSVQQLRALLLRADVEIRPTISRPSPTRGRKRKGFSQHMVWPSDVDTAIAERVGLEAMATAARRVGVPGYVLHDRLLAVGVPKPKRKKRWLVSDEQVQRAMAGYKPPRVVAPICTEVGCTAPHYCRDLCALHYRRHQRSERLAGSDAQAGARAA